MNLGMVYYGDCIYIVMMFLLAFASIGGVIWVLIRLWKERKSSEK